MLTAVGPSRANGLLLQDAIVFPTSVAPTRIEADRILDAHVRLRLPLTPPPGVQQSAAVKDWYVTLSMKGARTLGAKNADLRYKVPLMRIRPLKGEVYRITAELPPWLPDGQYDLTLTGPGTETKTTQSVLLGDKTPTRAGKQPTVVESSPEKLVIRNPYPEPLRYGFQIVLNPEEIGVSTRMGETPLDPTAVCFARLPIDGSRVLAYTVVLPPSTSEHPTDTVIRFLPTSRTDCKGTIELSSAAANDAIAYRDLRFRTAGTPHSVIWDFGDGRYGVGNPVRHRFLLTDEAKIEVWGVDRSGRVCAAATTAALNELTSAGGCSCIAVGH